MRLHLFVPVFALVGCASPSAQAVFGTSTAPDKAMPASMLHPAPPPPPAGAVTADQFDTTTAVDREAATAARAPAGDLPLGVTIATLGPPAEPGIWLKTALVTVPTAGRVTYRGMTINIALRPSGGAAGSGSQMSLAAMRLIDAPLTSLPELTVFAGQS